jgi:hypothetical protein
MAIILDSVLLKLYLLGKNIEIANPIVFTAIGSRAGRP